MFYFTFFVVRTNLSCCHYLAGNYVSAFMPCCPVHLLHVNCFSLYYIIFLKKINGDGDGDMRMNC